MNLNIDLSNRYLAYLLHILESKNLNEKDHDDIQAVIDMIIWK